MTSLPGFTAEASLYQSRGPYYQAAGEAPSESRQSVALAQPPSIPGGPAPPPIEVAPWGVAWCILPAGKEKNLPCYTYKQAYFDRSCNRYLEGAGRWCTSGTVPLGSQGESRCTSGTGICTRTKRLYYDASCRLVEEVGPPVCDSCPEGWDDCIRNCRNEGGSGPECSRECIQRGCD